MTSRTLAIVGAGRVGTALARALTDTRREPGAALLLDGPFGRGFTAAGYDAVLLCVPDAEIANAASVIVPGPMIGHCSGATALAALGKREAFSLHPLMTVPAEAEPAAFAGATAAIAGSSARALAFARELAERLAMEPLEVAESDRAAYHAAASIAANFLVTLEACAERLAAGTGLERRMLVPLVRSAVENWASLGPERALTGPVARGDVVTVARQRAAVAERTPELTGLFDALVAATEALAARPAPAAAGPDPIAARPAAAAASEVVA